MVLSARRHRLTRCELQIPHDVWTEEEVKGVKQTHVEPDCRADEYAFKAVKALRWSFDTFSGYRFGDLTKQKVDNTAGVLLCSGGPLCHAVRLCVSRAGW